MTSGLLFRDGSEFVANTVVAGDQIAPAVAALASGGYVTVWTDLGTNYSGRGVIAQLFDATGHKVGDEIVVSYVTNGNPVVTALSGGGFAVDWTDLANNKFQIFDAAGSKVGTEVVAVNGTGGASSIAMLSGDRFVVMNEFYGNGQIFDGAGHKVGGALSLANTSNFVFASVAGLANGGFVAVGQTNDHHIATQIFDANGNKIGTQNEIVSPYNGPGYFNIAGLSGGGFVISWKDSATILTQAYDSVGGPVSGIVRVNTTEESASQGDVTSIGNNQYLVTWTATATSGTIASDVRGQVFDASGTRIGSEFLVSRQTDSPNRDHGNADSAMLTSGEIVAVWQGSGPGDPRTPGTDPSSWDHGIRGQIFAPLGAATLDIVPSATTLSEIAIQNLPVLQLSTVSPAVNANYSYQLVADSTGGAFAISGNNLVVINNSLLDAGGTAPSVTVRVSDNAGNVTQEVINLTVSDDMAGRRYAASAETRVSSEATDAQIDPSIARLGTGGFVATWTDTSYRGDGTGYAIHAQLYDAAGAKAGEEFLVNTVRNAIQDQSAVTQLASGGFVVTWATNGATGNEDDIAGQIFAADGTKIGTEFKVNTSVDGTQYAPDVAGLASGGFVISWVDPTARADDASGSAVRLQLFDAAGAKVGDERLVETSTTGNQDAPSVAALADGGFVATWTDASGLGGDASSTSIKGQRFDATGDKIGSEFLINTQTSGAQNTPVVIAIDVGFVVSWTDRSFVKAQMFDLAGHKVGDEITVSSLARAPSLSALPDGGFVVGWSSNDLTKGDPSGGSIMAQMFNSYGGKVGDSFVVNSHTNNAQTSSDMVTLADGTVSVVWVDQSRSTYLGDLELRQLTPTIAGNFGSAGSDTITITETAHDNFIYGLAGNDVLRGSDARNVMYGGTGDDRMIGGASNDLLDGGTGADQLYGGLGNDTYYVDRADDLVFENANEGTDTVIASAGFYLYANIENLTLAAGAGDIFGVGNELANVITGNEGSNLLIAGAGADVVHGGAGIDSLFGQDGNDQLYGDAGVDYLVGGTGDDMLDGGTGADALYGEDGNDILWGGTDFATDILVGGAGNDVLHGDSGLGDYDLMDGGSGDDTYYVDTPADLTFEAVGGGTDTVHANIVGAGYYLYANVENLILDGVTPFGVGNELNNQLTGNAIGNYLLGGAGDDVLNGKAGNDVLFGEAGADTFVFEHGTGADVIGDFTAGTDRIDLTAIGYTWQQVQNSLHENGGNTAIDLGGGDLVVLNGVTIAQLHAGDFILAGGTGASVPAALSIEGFQVGSDVAAGQHAAVAGHPVPSAHIWALDGGNDGGILSVMWHGAQMPIDAVAVAIS
ncbi:hypothetical protein BH10PSE14_BH10PSE14_10440 [soil metagenome]